MTARGCNIKIYWQFLAQSTTSCKAEDQEEGYLLVLQQSSNRIVFGLADTPDFSEHTPPMSSEMK